MLYREYHCVLQIYLQVKTVGTHYTIDVCLASIYGHALLIPSFLHALQATAPKIISMLLISLTIYNTTPTHTLDSYKLNRAAPSKQPP